MQSYLKFEFSYIATEYISAFGTLIKVCDVPVSGTQNFNISYIP